MKLKTLTVMLAAAALAACGGKDEKAAADDEGDEGGDVSAKRVAKALGIEDDVEEGMEYETPGQPITELENAAYREMPEEHPRQTQQRQQEAAEAALDTDALTERALAGEQWVRVKY